MVVARTLSLKIVVANLLSLSRCRETCCRGSRGLKFVAFLLVAKAFLRCRVVVVAKQKYCRVPSSAQGFIRIPFLIVFFLLFTFLLFFRDSFAFLSLIVFFLLSTFLLFHRDSFAFLSFNSFLFTFLLFRRDSFAFLCSRIPD